MYINLFSQSKGDHANEREETGSKWVQCHPTQGGFFTLRAPSALLLQSGVIALPLPTDGAVVLQFTPVTPDQHLEPADGNGELEHHQ